MCVYNFPVFVRRNHWSVGKYVHEQSGHFNPFDTVYGKLSSLSFGRREYICSLLSNSHSWFEYLIVPVTWYGNRKAN